MEWISWKVMTFVISLLGSIIILKTIYKCLNGWMTLIAYWSLLTTLTWKMYWRNCLFLEFLSLKRKMASNLFLLIGWSSKVMMFLGSKENGMLDMPPNQNSEKLNSLRVFSLKRMLVFMILMKWQKRLLKSNCWRNIMHWFSLNNCKDKLSLIVKRREFFMHQDTHILELLLEIAKGLKNIWTIDLKNLLIEQSMYKVNKIIKMVRISKVKDWKLLWRLNNPMFKGRQLSKY